MKASSKSNRDVVTEETSQLPVSAAVGKKFPFVVTKKFLFACALFVFVAGTLVACVVFWAGESPHAAMVISTAPVTRGDIERTLHATGIIKPEDGAEVKTGSRFTGVIERLHVRLGDKVGKGQLIAELDSREQNEEHRRLEAALQRLRAELRLHEETYPKRIAEAAAELDIARSNAEYTQQTYKIYRSLRPEKAVAIMDVNRAVHERKAALETVLVKQSLKERLEKEDTLIRERLRHSIKETEAERNSAAIRLSYARILSPIDGVVSGITAQEGETVVAGLQVVDLITVLDVERLELRVYVDENDIGEVSPGQEVRFRVEAYPEKIFSGKVALIHPSPELRNNIVYYRALVRLFPETALALRPEMTARCEIVVDNRKDVLLMPNTAFKWIGQKRLVFRMGASGEPVPVKVATGLEGGARVEVHAGLREGDSVVTEMTLPESIPPAWRE